MIPRSKIPRSLRFVTAVAVALLVVVGFGFVYRDELRAARARNRYPRVVLVTFDTLNIDFTGPFNDSVDYTPNLNRFASEGVLFERAYTTVPITLPSHASLLTGQTPPDLGVMLNGDTLGEEVETLAEILQDAGYKTAAFTSLGVVKSRFNLDQGFDHYDDEFFLDNFRWYRTADEVFEAAAPWINEMRTQPFFVWLHFSDPHEPYVAKGSPPDTRLTWNGETLGEWNLQTRERQTVRVRLPPGSHRFSWTALRSNGGGQSGDAALRLRLKDVESLRPWLLDQAIDLESEKALEDSYTLELKNDTDGEIELALRFEATLSSPPLLLAREQYAREVEFTDHYLGELRDLIDGQDQEGDTFWILASDHGEGLYRLGILGHADFVQEDQLRILWLMRGPGISAGARVKTPVLIQDVLPTTLQLLGLATPENIAGHSQNGCWRRGRCVQRDEWWAFGASGETGSITGVAGFRPPWKLVWQERPRSGCYNLADDPWERVNLGTPFTRDPSLIPPEVEYLNERIWKQKDLLQMRLDERGGAETDDERLEMLRSLGYLGN